MTTRQINIRLPLVLIRQMDRLAAKRANPALRGGPRQQLLIALISQELEREKQSSAKPSQAEG